MSFQHKYYHHGINYWINNSREDTLVHTILAMEYDELEEIRHEINAEIELSPPGIRSNDYYIKRRCFIYRTQQLRKAGRLHPKISLIDEACAAFLGIMGGLAITNTIFRK